MYLSRILQRFHFQADLIWPDTDSPFVDLEKCIGGNNDIFDYV